MITSSILVSFLTMSVGLVSLVNQAIMAKIFGASMNMDAYLIAVSVPMLVSGVLSVVLSYSLVPELITNNPDDVTYRRFCGLLLIGFIAASTLVSFWGFVFAPLQIEIFGGSLSVEAKRDAIVIGRISWGTAGSALVVGHLNAMHNVSRKFVLPVAVSVLPVAGMIVSGILFGPTHGPVAVSWGMFAGSLGAIPALLAGTLEKLDFSQNCLLMRGRVAEYLMHLPKMALAALCFTVYQAIDAYWAPQVGTGNLAYLSYAQRVVVGIGSLVIAGPSAVLLPRFAEACAAGRVSDLLRDAARTLRMVLIVSVPVALFVGILSTPLVRLLFERGAFAAEATSKVAALLPWLMVGMVAMLSVVIVFRALFAKQDVTQVSILGAVATVLYFALSGVLTPSFGVKGIAIAYAASWWLVFGLSVVSLWRGSFDMVFSNENKSFIWKLSAITGATGLVVLAGKSVLNQSELGGWALLWRLGLIAVLAGVVYLSVALRMLRVEEIRMICLSLRSHIGLSRFGPVRRSV